MGELVSLSGDDFAGAASYDDGAMHAWLRGSADYGAVDVLHQILARIHEEASRLGVKEVVVDLRQLEFMNSSCFKSFVSWITDIRELAQDHQYKVTLLSNPKLHWQKRSLYSLSCFAVDLVSVRE